MERVMRSLAILLTFFLAACGATVNPTRTATGRDALAISCDGLVYNWNICNRAAARACPRGYDVIDREEKKTYTDYGSFMSRKLVVSCR
jgi:hypothetical protein